jgi:predicted anti-sigma-YlaC factor YlaD
MTIPLPCRDGELHAAILRGSVSSPSEMAAIERHLAECAQCRAVADLLSDFDEHTAHEPTATEPAGNGGFLTASSKPARQPGE